jgi:hypothetical protein
MDLQPINGWRQYHDVYDTAEPCQRVKTAAHAKEPRRPVRNGCSTAWTC